MDPSSMLIAGAVGAPTLTLVGVFIFLQSRKKSLQQLLQSPAEGNISFPFEESIHYTEEWLGRRMLSKKQKAHLHQHKEALSEMHICTQALVQPEHSTVYWVAKPDYHLLRERLGSKHSAFFEAVNEHLREREKKEWHEETLEVFREVARSQYSSAQTLSQKMLDKDYHPAWHEKITLCHTSIQKCLDGGGEEEVIALYNQAFDTQHGYKKDFPYQIRDWEDVKKALEVEIIEHLNTQARAVVETTRLNNLPIVLAKLGELKSTANSKSRIHFETFESLYWAWRKWFEDKIKMFVAREAEPLIHNARLDDLPRRISEMETLRDSMRYARQIPSEFFDSLHQDWQSRLEDEVLAYELIGIRKALVKRDYDTFRALIRQLQKAGIGAKKADFSVLYQLVETMARFDQLDFEASTSTALQSGIELVQRQESWFVKQVPEIWEQLQVCIKDWEARWLQKWAQEQQWSKILQLYINDPQKRADPQNDPIVMQAIETILQTGPHKEGELYLSMWISLKRRSQNLEGLEAPWVNTLSTKLQHFFDREANVHFQAVRVLGSWVSAPAYAKRLGDYLSIFKRFNALVAQSADAQVYPIAYAYWISGLKVETALAEFIDMKEELKLLQQSLENDSTAVLNRLCDEREKGTFSLLKLPSEKEELVVQIVEKFSREAMLQPPLVALEMLRKLARLFVEEERIQRLFKQFVQAYLQSKTQYEVKDLRFVVEGLLSFPQDAYFIQQFKVIVYNFITEYLQEQGIFKDTSRRSVGNTATKEAQRERLIRVKQSITQLADARQQSLKKIALPDLRVALEQLFEGLRSKVEIQFMAFPGQVRDEFDLTFDGFLRAGRSTVYSDRTNHPHFTRIGVLLAECLVALEGIIQQLAIKKRRR